MKKIFGILLLLTLISFTNSCRKKIQGSDADFVGHWTNDDDTHLTIESSGAGKYEYNDGTSKESISGRAVIDGDKLRFSFLGIKKEYSIDKRPFNDKGVMTMVLSGDTFEKN